MWQCVCGFGQKDTIILQAIVSWSPTVVIFFLCFNGYNEKKDINITLKQAYSHQFAIANWAKTVLFLLGSVCNVLCMISYHQPTSPWDTMDILWLTNKWLIFYFLDLAGEYSSFVNPLVA